MIDKTKLEQMRQEYWQMSTELMRHKLVTAALTQEIAGLSRHIRRLKTDIARLKNEKS